MKPYYTYHGFIEHFSRNAGEEGKVRFILKVKYPWRTEITELSTIFYPSEMAQFLRGEVFCFSLAMHQNPPKTEDDLFNHYERFFKAPNI